MFESESDKGSKKVDGKKMMFKNVEELFIYTYIYFVFKKGMKQHF